MDQLKAIRQDLVVQDINDEFTVKVYEFNVKCSIVCHDLNELNQVWFVLSSFIELVPIDAFKTVQIDSKPQKPPVSLL